MLEKVSVMPADSGDKTIPERNYEGEATSGEAPQAKKQLGPNARMLAKALENPDMPINTGLTIRGVGIKERQANSTALSATGESGALKDLTPRHRAIMRAVLKGMSAGEIAEVSGLTERAVRMIVGSEIFQKELLKLEARADDECISGVVDVRAKIKELSGVSIDVLDKILRDRMMHPKLRADIAFDILDRDGYGAVKKVEESIAVSLVDATVSAFAKRKAKLVADNAPIIEVEGVEEKPAAPEAEDPLQGLISRLATRG